MIQQLLRSVEYDFSHQAQLIHDNPHLVTMTLTPFNQTELYDTYTFLHFLWRMPPACPELIGKTHETEQSTSSVWFLCFELSVQEHTGSPKTSVIILGHDTCFAFSSMHTYGKGKRTT